MYLSWYNINTLKFKTIFGVQHTDCKGTGMEIQNDGYPRFSL